MKLSTLLPVTLIFALMSTPSNAAPIWSTGSSLFEVIGYDMEAHDFNKKLSDYQTNAVCMLLGYFNGFAESSFVAAHYNVGALPFVLPDNITNDQIEHLLYKYLSDNPDKLQLKGGVLLVAALSKAFPNPAFKPPTTPDN